MTIKDVTEEKELKIEINNFVTDIVTAVNAAKETKKHDLTLDEYQNILNSVIKASSENNPDEPNDLTSEDGLRKRTFTKK